MGATFNGNEKDIQYAGTKLLDSLPSGVVDALDLSKVPEDVSFAVRELLGDMNFAVQDMRTHLGRQTERNKRLAEELKAVVAEKNQKVAALEATLLENHALLEKSRAQVTYFGEECKKLESMRADAEIKALALRVEADELTAKLQADAERHAEEQQDLAFAHSDDIVRIQGELAREKNLTAQLSEFLKSHEEEAAQSAQKLSDANSRLLEVESALRQREELVQSLGAEIEKEKEQVRQLVAEHEASLIHSRGQIERLNAQRDEWKMRFTALPKVWAIEKAKHVEKENELTLAVSALEKECADLKSKLELALASHEEEIRKLQENSRNRITENEKALVQAKWKSEELAEKCDEWQKQFIALSNREKSLEASLALIEQNSSERIRALEKECRELTTELELATVTHAAEVTKIRDDAHGERKRISDEFASILVATKRSEEAARAEVEKWTAACAELRNAEKNGPTLEEFHKMKHELRRFRDQVARLQLERDLAMNQQTETIANSRVRTDELEANLLQLREELAREKVSYQETSQALEGERARARATEERMKAEIQNLTSKLYLLNMRNDPQMKAVPTLAVVPPATEKLADVLQEKSEEIEAIKRRLTPKRDISS